MLVTKKKALELTKPLLYEALAIVNNTNEMEQKGMYYELVERANKDDIDAVSIIAFIAKLTEEDN